MKPPIHSGAVIEAMEAAILTAAWTTSVSSEPAQKCRCIVDSLGLHLLGKISLGTQYDRGTAAKPKPIRNCAMISREILLDPGAIPAPMKEMTDRPTNSVFLAWNVSEAEEMTGERTACTSDSAFSIQVWDGVALRLFPM